MPQISIPTHGSIECHRCKSKVTISMTSRWYRAVCETCGRNLSNNHRSSNVFAIFEAMGITFDMDWDGQLLVESEEPVPGKLRHVIFLIQHELLYRLQQQGRRAQAMFVGGSLAGQSHNQPSAPYLHHQGRAHWEVYEYRNEQRDPRLYYVGRATSRKKARNGQFVPSE